MELEKFRLTKTRFGMACSVDVSVIVFPDPGGPHRIRGLWEASHAFSTSTCLERTSHSASEEANRDHTVSATADPQKWTPSSIHQTSARAQYGPRSISEDKKNTYYCMHCAITTDIPHYVKTKP